METFDINDINVALAITKDSVLPWFIFLPQYSMTAAGETCAVLFFKVKFPVISTNTGLISGAIVA